MVKRAHKHQEREHRLSRRSNHHAEQRVSTRNLLFIVIHLPPCVARPAPHPPMRTCHLPGQTYNGEMSQLCSRCHTMLTIPECEMHAATNTYKNERQLFTRGLGSCSPNAASTPSSARASIPGPANPIFHAPPRSVFGSRRRRHCRVWVPDVDLPKRAHASSNGSDDSAPCTESDVPQPARLEESKGEKEDASEDGPPSTRDQASQTCWEDEPEPSQEESQGEGGASDDGATTEDEISQATSEDEPGQEESEGEDEASDDDATTLDTLKAAAMQENWTYEEARRHRGLPRYLKTTMHVRFGDKGTKMVMAKTIEPYDREKDSLPWTTVHDVQAFERVRSALFAEITASGPAGGVPSPNPESSEEAATIASDADNASDTEDANDAEDAKDSKDAPPTAAGGFLTGLPRVSRKTTMLGMAAVAVGLVAWGVRRR